MNGENLQVGDQPATHRPAGKLQDLYQRVGWIESRSSCWGRLPEIALFEAILLAVIAWVFVQARAVGGGVELFFWFSLAAMLAPVAIRLASSTPSREERLALVLLLGLAFYLVKVMHSPAAFTFPDELTHLRNVREVLESGRLFQSNPLQPSTIFYPGLPAVTSLVASMSGVSLFTAGILVIGAARLILFLGLFLIYENISASARVAGLAVLLYMANPNFLYWTAQYSYESLALPIAIMVLFAVIRREQTSISNYRGAWTAISLLGILMVVITHHMTSYILSALLVALVVFYVVRSRGKRWGPLDLALAATGASALWLFFVANSTIPYLAFVFGDAVQSSIQMVLNHGAGRVFFKSASTGYVAPVWERLNGMGAVLLIAAGLPFGALAVWQRYRKNVFALLLTIIALLYLPVQLLRLSTGGWEIANRSSEFLFIGIAFVLAVGVEKFWLSGRFGWIKQIAFAGLVIVLFFGGLIIGWPPRGRLPRPYMVSADGEHVVEPPSVNVAEWMLTVLGPNNRIAASKADAKVIGAYDQDPASSSSSTGGIRDMFFSDVLGFTGRNSLRKRGIQYIVLNRRLSSWDHVIGFYFINPTFSPSWEVGTLDPEQFNKFDGLQKVNRILDTGDIVVYDVGIFLHTPMETKPAEALSPPQKGGGVNSPTVAAGGALQPVQAQRLSEKAAGSAIQKHSGLSTPQQAAPVIGRNICAAVPPAVFVEYLAQPANTLYRLVLGQIISADNAVPESCIQGNVVKIGNMLWVPPRIEVEQESNP